MSCVLTTSTSTDGTYTTTDGTTLTTNNNSDYYLIDTTSTPTWYNLNAWSTIYPNIDSDNPLQKLSYLVDFDIDKKELLSNNIKGIKNNKILFNCQFSGNRIQPYELIMKLISENKKFQVKVSVHKNMPSDTINDKILTICYTNFQFIEIINNLNFNSENCDFSVLKVKFKYDKVLYENHKLSEKELRMDKLKKIIEEK